MERQELEQIVRDTVVEYAGIGPTEIRAESKFVDDLGFDSLDAIELVIELEEKLGCEIDDQEAERQITFGQLVDYLLQLPEIQNKVNKEA